MKSENEKTIICDPSDIFCNIEMAYEPTNLNELSWYSLGTNTRKAAKHIFNAKREFQKMIDYKKWLFDFAEYVNLEPTFFEKHFPVFGVNRLRKRVESFLS